MRFDSSLTMMPDLELRPVTLGDLIASGRGLSVHCIKCGRHTVLAPETVPLPAAKPVPEMAGRFKCSQCGSRHTEARPDYSDLMPKIMGYSHSLGHR